MAALTINRVIGRFGEDENVSNPVISFGIAANAKLFAGAQVGLNAAGFVVPGGAVNGCIKVLGISRKLYDNTGGANNAFQVEIEVGVFPMNAGAGVDALTIANLWTPLFAIDDNTVGLTDGLGTRALAGLLAGFNAQGLPLVQYLPQTMAADYFPYTWQKTAADGAAATATTEFPLLVAPFSGKVANLKIANGATQIVANDANFATLILSKRTAGGAAVTVAQFSTQTNVQPLGINTVNAWATASGPAAGIVATFSQGDNLTLQITKSGTGVVVPISTFEVDILPL